MSAGGESGGTPDSIGGTVIVAAAGTPAQAGIRLSGTAGRADAGGTGPFGGGGAESNTIGGNNGVGPGAGASGAKATTLGQQGGTPSTGIIIVREYA